MTNLLLFLILTLAGSAMLFGGIKAKGFVSVVLIIIGLLLLIPGAYGIFTALI